MFSGSYRGSSKPLEDAGEEDGTDKAINRDSLSA